MGGLKIVKIVEKNGNLMRREKKILGKIKKRIGKGFRERGGIIEDNKIEKMVDEERI